MISKKVIMLGATGEVGNHTAIQLSEMPEIEKLTLLGRRPVENLTREKVAQHTIDIFSTNSYEALIEGHDSAVCTLGVGEPSKMAKDEFIKIDRDAVLDFAKACKKAGVKNFELLSSVATNAKSSNYYLRAKGELNESLVALGFDSLSIFHPSMIMTPKNRYGLSQGVALKVVPWIDPFLIGPLKKFRSITSKRLGKALAMNLLKEKSDVKVEDLHWEEFIDLTPEN